MKILKYIFSLIVAFGVISCEKNVVEYDTTPIADVAEFQLHYFVPVDAKAVNYIYKMEINNQIYTNNDAALLTTYNGVPGRAGRFYTTSIGKNDVKLYKKAKNDNDEWEHVLAYDQSCTLNKGKQNVFVYDFNKPPIVFDNGYPYITNVTEDTNSECWVKFYNFLYEKEEIPTDLKLQYQYQYTLDYKTKERSEWANVGNPIAFGKTTDWQSIKLNKLVYNSSGKCRVDYRIKVVDAAGNVGDELQVIDSKKEFVNYTFHKDGYIGRRYHHVLSGMRTTTPRTAVRQFTAL